MEKQKSLLALVEQTAQLIRSHIKQVALSSHGYKNLMLQISKLLRNETHKQKKYRKKISKKR